MSAPKTPAVIPSRNKESWLKDGEIERCRTMSKYIPVQSSVVPVASLRWDTPLCHQGQPIVVQYGTFGKYVADDGAEWKRIGDATHGPILETDWTYYRLVQDSPSL